MTTDTPDLAELRRLLAAATPGPWRYHRSIFPPTDKINYAYVSFGKDDGESGLGTGTLSEADARFLAAAVAYVRAALLNTPPTAVEPEPRLEPVTDRHYEVGGAE